MPSNQMDPECIELCKAINSIKGLCTVESCCGHGEQPFRVYLVVEDPKEFPVLLYFCDPCHVGFKWTCEVYTDCGMSPVFYCLESKSKGEKAYKEANIIAEKINEFLLEEKTCCWEGD